jgi:hypothetical protein
MHVHVCVCRERERRENCDRKKTLHSVLYDHLDLCDFLRCVLFERVHDGEQGGVSDQLMVVNSKEEEETATAELYLPAITKPNVKKMK